MANLPQLTTRSQDDDVSYGPASFAFLGIFVVACCVAASLFYLRHCRRRALQQQMLPQYHRPGHHRTLTITTAPAGMRGETVLVYDEKMTLLTNSAPSSNGPVPEIRVTFPDEDAHSGESKSGRVVVLRISDSGSVGMEPLSHENLPPYHASDAERFQSLDLERMGGLREKHEVQARYS